MRAVSVVSVVGASMFAMLSVACTPQPQVQREAAYLPPSTFGIYLDNDVGAIQEAAWAFASPANTLGNPVTAIQGIVALEYLAGELKASPRWVGIDASVKLHMGDARNDVRQIIGIRPDAPPQAVVNALLWTSFYLQSGQHQAAMQVLSAPIFTRPPQETLRLLSNLPYVQEANLATSRAQSETFIGGARG